MSLQIGLLGISLVLMVLFISTGCISLKKLYSTEVKSEINKQKSFVKQYEIIDEEAVKDLPIPVIKHFRVCGFMGQQQTTNVKVVWENAFIRMNRNSGWLKLKCEQFNFVIPEPARIVLMRSKIAGIIPFGGRDKYQDGHGNMYIRLLGQLTIGNVSGNNMDHSALVTLLAETFLAPSYALQDYISWESIDSVSAKATIKFNNISVTGLFLFNENGEFNQFITEDRYQEETDTETVKWSAVATEYVKRNGVRFPTDLRAIWHEKNGDFEYFKGKITELQFNELKP